MIVPVWAGASFFGVFWPDGRHAASFATKMLVFQPYYDRSVLKQFKLMLVEAGVTDDPASYGLHSMRRGAATNAVNNGATDHSVQKQMRVSSMATVRRYATLNKAALKSASSAIFKKL